MNRLGLTLYTTVVALACGSTEASRRDSATTQRVSTDSATLARADSSRIQGRVEAPMWIVEISDFQCPYCAEWHERTYRQLKSEFIESGKARFAYINLPLPSHANAWPAASAAMCAGLQGKFWEMHDALFSTQRQWASEAEPTPVFMKLATTAGVDPAAMRECISSKRLQPLIQADYDRSVQNGVNSTPTFIVGGVTLSGAHPIENFRKVVDSLMTAGAARAP